MAPALRALAAPVVRRGLALVAELALLAVAEARVARAVMRWAPTEVAARAAWVVMPVMVGRVVMVVRVRMPVPVMGRRRAAPVVPERAVVPVARVAWAAMRVPRALMAVAVMAVRAVTPVRVAMALTAAMVMPPTPTARPVVMAAIPEAPVAPLVGGRRALVVPVAQLGSAVARVTRPLLAVTAVMAATD